MFKDIWKQLVNLDGKLKATFLLGFVLLFIFREMVLNPIWTNSQYLLKQKPEVVFNIANIDEMDSDKITNETILYGVQGDIKYLLAINIKDKVLAEKSGEFWGQVNQIVECPKCKQVSFSVRNIGKAVAKSVKFDVIVDGDIKLRESEADRRVQFHCGGLTSKGCSGEIGPLSNQDGAVVFTGVNRGSIKSASCEIIDFPNLCKTNLFNIRVKILSPETYGISLSNKMIYLPSKGHYYYDPKSVSWIQLNDKREMIPIKRGGSKFE